MGKETSPAPVYLRIKSAFQGATDADIARRISEAGGKVGKSAVSQWKSGSTEPSTDNLLIVSKLTGVPLDVLTGKREASIEALPEYETSSQPMTVERFIAELRTLGVEDFNPSKSWSKLTSQDMEEVLRSVRKQVETIARAAAEALIEQKVKDKGK